MSLKSIGVTDELVCAYIVINGYWNKEMVRYGWFVDFNEL